jgi:hypothetical protein
LLGVKHSGVVSSILYGMGVVIVGARKMDILTTSPDLKIFLGIRGHRLMEHLPFYPGRQLVLLVSLMYLYGPDGPCHLRIQLEDGIHSRQNSGPERSRLDLLNKRAHCSSALLSGLHSGDRSCISMRREMFIISRNLNIV